MRPENKWTKFRGVTLALICLVPLGVCDLVVFLWKILRAPGKWVAMAFRDLLEDETHLDKMKQEGG